MVFRKLAIIKRFCRYRSGIDGEAARLFIIIKNNALNVNYLKGRKFFGRLPLYFHEAGEPTGPELNMRFFR